MRIDAGPAAEVVLDKGKTKNEKRIPTNFCCFLNKFAAFYGEFSSPNKNNRVHVSNRRISTIKIGHDRKTTIFELEGENSPNTVT